MLKYKLVEKKSSVVVYAGDSVMCIIDNDFAVKQGFETALEYCENVFMSDEA